MRVLQVMECTIGGTRRHLRDLAHGLSERGVDVTVACAALREPRMRGDMERMTAAGIAVVEIPMVRAITPLTDAWHALRLWLRSVGRGLDVIHTHSSKAGALGRVAGLFGSRARRIHTPHTFAAAFDGGHGQGGQPAGPPGLLVSTERLLGKVTHRMIHVSAAERVEGQALGVISEPRARVVPNGIDPGPYARPAGGAALRAELGIPLEAPLVGSVGLLNDAKGYDLLVDAMAHLPSDAHLLIVGHGEREASLRERAAAAGLDGRVHLPGWRDEVGSTHDALDVFVLSSRWEGMAYSLMEAMAAGLPCVSTDVNGSPELLLGEAARDAPCGLIVPRGDASALGTAVAGLLSDRAAADALGRRAAARLAAEFTIDHMIDRTLALYREALDER